MIISSALLSTAIYVLSLSFIWKLKVNYFDSSDYIRSIHSMNLLRKANGINYYQEGYIKKYDHFFKLIKISSMNFVTSLIAFTFFHQSTFIVSLALTFNILIIALFGLLLWSAYTFNSSYINGSRIS